MTFHARTDETAEWLNYLQPEGLVVGANVVREQALPPVRQTPLEPFPDGCSGTLTVRRSA